ncbi:cytotoxic translational repressor of toxin-antitoxin stability system [Mycobacterium sp. M1]|uniref:Cytotoxic translational repressor of toxin-antitoxin stability system n=1 Tax=Mycolicibacter acidiphilus TaxID=2835306 RepID=A0ABS5RL65_9MYCO|nr:cytotoxic translational repressor of toxin-antitoxin stability system [Mycolicibacter acidiphilus]MBS9534231.1 cytotoxic translational repressor of toxin-antitoxin stability system [Mycolicibacter acidiphilus]
MSWPAPTRADHDKFCRVEGWTRVRDAAGRTGTHHVTYEFVLPDGRILRTRISHPPNRTGYGARIWAHILRDQLCVDEATFWAAVRDGAVPMRSRATLQADPLPTEVAVLLVNRVGLTREQVAAMSRAEAIEQLNRFWSEGG